jgi:membrane protein YqaA with SNARE-associated domain
LKLFTRLYDYTLSLSKHPQAERYLFALSFAESSFFPIPPDVMLVPMTLAKPQSGWRYAVLTTIASVIGGLLGYLIGLLALETIEPFLMQLGYWEGYLAATGWFLEWGFLAVFIAGFSPIPYKVFAIAAGALNMLLPAFILASLIGRGSRFFLVTGLLRWGGEPMEKKLRNHVEKIGWFFLVILVVFYIAIRIGIERV